MELQILTFSEYVQAINEGLIKTYDIDKTIDYMHTQLNHLNVEHKIFKGKRNTIKLKLKNFRSIDSTEINDVIDYTFLNFLNRFGWFSSSMEMEHINGSEREKKFDKDYLINNKKIINNVIITFESKFDEISDVPDKLYHLSIQEYSKKIEKYGISPKTKSKLTNHDYDGRIYVCRTINDCKFLIKKMKLYYLEKLFNDNNPKNMINTKWIIYEIDAKAAKIDKMYNDPNYFNGFYLLNHISPEFVKAIEQE